MTPIFPLEVRGHKEALSAVVILGQYGGFRAWQDSKLKADDALPSLLAAVWHTLATI